MTAAIDWSARAESLQVPRTILIGGWRGAAQSGKTYDVMSPRNGKIIATLPECDRADVDRAVKEARRSFDSGVWADMAPKERKKRLRRLAELIDAHRDELALMDGGFPAHRGGVGARAGDRHP